jgi:hypothetical protein
MMKLTRAEAIKRDRTSGEVYVSETPSGQYGVYGNDSGYCYGKYKDQDEAESAAGSITDEILNED